MGEKASMWNLWHGCHKWSEGCRHCYVYRTDGKYGKDSNKVLGEVVPALTPKTFFFCSNFALFIVFFC